MKSGVPSAIASAIRGSKTGRMDETLREVLRESYLSPVEKREVSEKVFAYYRWHGWVCNEPSLQKGVAQAWDLAQQFAANPAGISDEEILQKGFPDWFSEEGAVPYLAYREMQKPPLLWLRLKEETRDEVLAELPDLVPGPFPNSFQYSVRVDLFKSESFQQGRFEIQDISSQAVGWIASPQPAQSWWDACAGEGGKALHWSELMKKKGLIWCSDRSHRRLRLLKERAARAGMFNYRSATWEGKPPLPWKNRYDGILVDAPCTGSGTWQRNPQARWTAGREEIAELAAVQVSLLESVAQALKPGGKLYYSVCTLARAETEGVVQKISDKLPNLRPLPWKHPVTGKDAPAQFLWPHELHGNGMFVAAWEVR